MPIDLALLARHDSIGSQLSVLGVRVGDSASKLRGLSFSTVEPMFGGRMSFNSGQYTWTPLGGESEVKLSPEELTGMIIDKGMRGRFRQEELVFEAADGLVERIFLFEPVLSSLKVDSEDAVRRVFGEPLGITRLYGSVSFRYPERKLLIHFSNERRTLTVVLGPDDWQPPTFSAQDLLQAFLDLSPALMPSAGTPQLNFEGPRRVKYDRLRAFLAAFGIKDHASMTQGDWIDPTKSTLHHDVIALLRQSADPKFEATNPTSLAWAYRCFLRYRCNVEQLLRHNDGWLECGDESLLGMIRMTNDANEGLRKLIEPIDEVLCALLDPHKRSFSLKQLMEHGYPDVDLKQLEMDEL